MSTTALTANSGRKARKPPVSEQPAAAPQPDPPAPAETGVLSLLGLHGLESVEPVILASLLTGDPLLLIGPHGTGKSMLLERLAAALGLEFRHYNASLICFDDLIGFPVPEQGSATLKYLQTPATIWDAEAVFFDEVSRCKPDVQNKLFCIIHERKVQGLALERLRYRWSAMNPPCTADGDDNYAGSLPLDSALADRYAFIVEMPDWPALSPEAQQTILARAGAPPDPAAPERLRGVLERARPLWQSASEQLSGLLASYVHALAPLLREAEIRLSVRRLVMLMRIIPAVHAVRLVLNGQSAKPEESAWVALSHSVPQIAEGKPAPRGKLRAAHMQAWQAASKGSGQDLQEILAEENPVLRLARAVYCETIDLQTRSTIVADCISRMPEGARYSTAFWLMDNNLAGRLVAAVAEQIAHDYSLAAATPQMIFQGHSTTEVSLANAIREYISQLADNDREGAALGRCLVAKLEQSDWSSPQQIKHFIHQWNEAGSLLRNFCSRISRGEPR